MRDEMFMLVSGELRRDCLNEDLVHLGTLNEVQHDLVDLRKVLRADLFVLLGLELAVCQS